jgi:hypothetical protein
VWRWWLWRLGFFPLNRIPEVSFMLLEGYTLSTRLTHSQMMFGMTLWTQRRSARPYLWSLKSKNYINILPVVSSYDLWLGHASTSYICMDEGYNTMVLNI